MDNEVTNGTVEAPQPAHEENAESPGGKAQFLLSRFLTLGEFKAEAELALDQEDEVALAITGTDAGLLVGPQGHILDALQYLVSLMVNKDRHGRTRISVDADGYRHRRTNTLSKFAHSLAEQVVATGQEAFTDPLSPQERRIIHTALADHQEIQTYSEGDEPRRYVVISPKDSDDAAAA